MKREIKFRIYDEENEEMLKQDEYVILINENEIEVNLIEKITKEDWEDLIEKYDSAGVSCTDRTYSDGVMYSRLDNFKIMQYTGFDDRNGIEIYEGDIVKGVGEHIGQSDVFYGDIGELQPMSYLNDYNFNNYEVIGNIYENPEIINYIEDK